MSTSREWLKVQAEYCYCFNVINVIDVNIVVVVNAVVPVNIVVVVVVVLVVVVAFVVVLFTDFQNPPIKSCPYQRAVPPTKPDALPKKTFCPPIIFPQGKILVCVGVYVFVCVYVCLCVWLCERVCVCVCTVCVLTKNECERVKERTDKGIILLTLGGGLLKVNCPKS